VCVVSVLDEYSGEVPLAFVVPHASLAQKIKNEAKEAQKVKAELLKVRMTL
jgi:4-coumarate--CoA ligase